MPKAAPNRRPGQQSPTPKCFHILLLLKPNRARMWTNYPWQVTNRRPSWTMFLACGSSLSLSHSNQLAEVRILAAADHDGVCAAKMLSKMLNTNAVTELSLSLNLSFSPTEGLWKEYCPLSLEGPLANQCFGLKNKMLELLELCRPTSNPHAIVSKVMVDWILQELSLSIVKATEVLVGQEARETGKPMRRTVGWNWSLSKCF